MKFPKNADIEEYKKSLITGAAKGAVVGGAIGIGAAAWLRRRTTFFHGAGGFQKMLVYVAPAAFCTIVNMELSSRSFEEHQRMKQHNKIPHNAPHKNANLWDQISAVGTHYKYGIILAGWASALGGSFWLVNRDKYMTKAQKIVQARVYAQGLTVALLVGSVLLSLGGTAKTDEDKAIAQSKSWERDLKYVTNANHPKDEHPPSEQKEILDRDPHLKEATDKAESQIDTNSKSVSNNPDAKASQPPSADPAKANEKNEGAFERKRQPTDVGEMRKHSDEKLQGSNPKADTVGNNDRKSQEEQKTTPKDNEGHAKKNVS